MTISIVIPVFNTEIEKFDKCIKSILNQKFEDFEVILIDDGSDNGVEKKCDDYAKLDSRIKVTHISNKGVSNARNVGINKASSEWIMFVDADDYLEDDCCTTLLSYVDEGIDLIVGEAKAFKNQTIKDQLSNNKIVIQNSKEKKELTESIFFGNNNFPKYIFIGCPWGKLFKKEVITKNNLKFKENLRNYEDGIFNTEYIYYASKIIIFEKYVYNYIIYNNSSSRKFEIKMLDDYEEVYKEMSLIENKYNYDFSKYMDSFKVKNLVYIFKRYSLSHEFNCSIIKKICNSNTYVSSIYNVDLKSLKRRCALTTIFARAHLYFAIYFLYKIK